MYSTKTIHGDSDVVRDRSQASSMWSLTSRKQTWKVRQHPAPLNHRAPPPRVSQSLVNTLYHFHEPVWEYMVFYAMEMKIRQHLTATSAPTILAGFKSTMIECILSDEDVLLLWQPNGRRRWRRPCCIWFVSFGPVSEASHLQTLGLRCTNSHKRKLYRSLKELGSSLLARDQRKAPNAHSSHMYLHPITMSIM